MFMEEILFNISVTRFQNMPQKDVNISIGANKILLNEFHFFQLGNLKCILFLNLSGLVIIAQKGHFFTKVANEKIYPCPRK